MKRKKSILAKLLIGLLVCAGAISLIAAGGRDTGGGGAVPGSAANVNPPGVYPIVKEQITINVGIRQSPEIENYETNLLTRHFQEIGNFRLNFDIFPVGNPGLERFLIMVAGGGTLPEVAVGFYFSEELIYQLGREGVALPLNDYYENWAYYFPQQIQKVSNPNMWQWMHSPDGNVYHVPLIQEQIGEYFSLRGWMNHAWLDNLGLQMPETTDQFRTVLEAFRDRDPNRNGRRDEIPAGGNNFGRGRLDDFLINSFIYNDTRDRLIVNNGRVDVIYNKPEYREALRYINGLMNDGLILDQIYTIDGGGLRAIIESQDVATVGFFTAGLAGAISPANRMRLEYGPMKPLRGPTGVNWTPYMPMGPHANFVITKDARNPEAIFRWGDYQMSEDASIWARYGVPDRDWRRPRPGERSLYDAMGFPPTLAPILPWGVIQNSHWQTTGPSILYTGLIDGEIVPDDPLSSGIPIARAAQLYRDLAPPASHRVDRTSHTYQEMAEIRDLKPQINSFVEESLALFVMGQRSIERDWDAYIQELNRMGLQRYIQLTQAGYERALGLRR